MRKLMARMCTYEWASVCYICVVRFWQYESFVCMWLLIFFLPLSLPFLFFLFCFFYSLFVWPLATFSFGHSHSILVALSPRFTFLSILLFDNLILCLVIVAVAALFFFAFFLSLVSVSFVVSHRTVWMLTFQINQHSPYFPYETKYVCIYCNKESNGKTCAIACSTIQIFKRLYTILGT